MKTLNKALLTAVFLLIFTTCDTTLRTEAFLFPFKGSDVSSGIKVLGNIKNMLSANHRVRQFPYASSVLDMQVFRDRIYLGYGCWANSSPSGATNTGPIPFMA